MKVIILVSCLTAVQSFSYYGWASTKGCHSTELHDWTSFFSHYDDPLSEEDEEYSLEDEIYKPKKSVSVTCTHITSENFNYTFTDDNYQHSEATIAFSTIPVLKPESFISTFRNVTKLSLPKIGIEELQPGVFDGFVKLRQIDLNSNKIKAIPKGVFNPMKSLRVLSISGNEIGEVDPEAFQEMTKLKTVFLNGNKIKVLKENLFRGLSNLNYVDVSDNPLEELQNINFTKFEAVIMKRTTLKRINANFSHLSTSKLDWQRNKLEVIDFLTFPETSTIILNHNCLREVRNFDKLKGQFIDMSYNNLTTMPGLPENITDLRLNNNKITILENSSNLIKSMEMLKLNENLIPNITQGPFLGLVALTELDLNNNLITTIESNSFSDMVSLERLLLPHNLLSRIELGTFDALENLNKLDISHNKIEELDSLLFVNLKKLSFLDISYNKIIEFDPSNLKNLNSLSINLNENMYTCGDLPNLLSYLYHNKINIDDAGSSDGPDNINGVSCVHKLARK